MNTTTKIGNIFDSKHSTLVNTVNCVGVMGKGIAAAFKERYPEMYNEYRERCNRGLVKPGEPYLYSDLIANSVLMFPTKDHWKSPSKIADISKGLDIFIEKYKDWGIDSIAFPPLGCGNGGLEWSTVGPLMFQKLSKLDIPIEIYAPFGTPKQELTREFLLDKKNLDLSLKGVRRRKLTVGAIAILEVLDRLHKQPFSNPIGRTMFQKVCYIMTEQGVDTGLDFNKGSYGPFSPGVRDLITLVANMNLVNESKLGRMIAITTTKEFPKIRKNYSTELDKIEKKISKTVDLFARIKSTDQAEEVTTVLFSARDLKSKSDQSVSEEQLYNYILGWKKSWNDDGKRESIADAIRNLEILSWLKLDYSESLDKVQPDCP